jgi:exopolysaccharide biosynthesis polyprenyl glycosylphosphotransferase
MIPRRFFWFFDSLVLALAFFVAYSAAPQVQALFTPGGSLAYNWIEKYLLPPTAASGVFPPIADFQWILFATLPGAILFLELFGAYRRVNQSLVRTVLTGAIAPFLSLSLVVLGLFAFKQNSWSRLFFFLYGAYAAVLLVSFRLILLAWWHKRRAAGFYAKNVVIIGSPFGLQYLADYFRDYLSQTEYRLFGYLSLCANQPPPAAKDVPCLGTIDQLGELAVHRPIHEVVVVPGEADGKWLKQIVKDCDYFRIALRIIPETLLADAPADLQSPQRDDPMHLPAIVLRPHELNSDALFVKRLIDVAVSGILLVLLSPLFLVVAIAIKVTTPRLSVFYPWRVVGQNGVEFTGYKFTTMIADADQRKSELMQYNEMTGPVFKIKEDPRVTRLGKFLRKYSINELPQLWSVLKGDMSLVGPRPAWPHELARYDFWHKRKLSVQSGITCLWQIRGRNEISSFDDWVKLDLEYIDNWSLWLDIKILIKTAWVVIRGSGS